MEAVHIDKVCAGDSLELCCYKFKKVASFMFHISLCICFPALLCIGFLLLQFFITWCMCLYFTMAVIDQRFNSIYSSNEKLRKGDSAHQHFCKTVQTQRFPHEYLLFPPQLSAVHFEGGQISIIRSPQNVRSDGQKLHRQWQESTEAVELENFR